MKPQYDHTQYEQAAYRRWEESGTLTPPPGREAKRQGKKPFTIIMPPPNANDPLHVGHAMFVTVEDILIRFHRMLGEASLWLPGTDHAGIETQYVYEKKLNKQGLSRFSYDRETLYRKIAEYVKENSGIALDQMRRLGASADWSRTKFTLDKEIVDLVLQTFERMQRDNLIYRDFRLVNYCPKCGTGYSELEVVHKETAGKLYTLLYPLREDKNQHLAVATTRPETMLGDVAVAVHPKDKRYQGLVGKLLSLPLTGREIPVVADEMVDPEFGTGAVKITPYHDQHDYEVWQRHKDEIPSPIQVIDLSGKMTAQAGEFAGQPTLEARKSVLAALREQGLAAGEKDHTHNVGHCYRCDRVIEPLPLAQFFIKVKTLTEKVLDTLENKETSILGSGHDKILKHWLKNLKDWNISRQVVWGIRMPIWYQTSGDTNGEITVGFLNADKQYITGKISELLKVYSFEEIEKGLQTLRAPIEAEFTISREKPGADYLQDTDTFDTWFSSGQWPVVTLQTAKEGDFDYYYPTSVMETAYDILPFWVMRMMMMGIYLTGKTPFTTVYLHGLVRDEKGQKMSKSKGNVINPLELVDKYGADALRMALVMSTTPGSDSAVGENKVKGMRNFANKIWNAARFIKLQTVTNETGTPLAEDTAFIKKLNEVISEVTNDLNQLKIGQAAETAHNEFWHWFCDICIEQSKAGTLSPTLLKNGLRTFMILLHPYMPFVTETLWQELEFNGKDGLLITQTWPSSVES